MNEGQPSNIASLPKAITVYLDRLTSAYPGITAVWLFGSRANGLFKARSDWDLLVFGDDSILESLRANETFRQPEIDLFVVHDGNRFESPWAGDDGTKLGRLQNSFEYGPDRYVYGYRWKEISESEASYISTRDSTCTERLRAWRIYQSDRDIGAAVKAGGQASNDGYK